MLTALCSLLPRIQVIGQTGNGAKALAAIRRHRPDVVTLDLHMPKKGGLEVLKSIQEQELKCTVIVLSGLIDEPHRRKCLELGASFVFDKVAELEAVRQLLGKM
jgi:DNA-binding NarL/FixJ family response regulator